MDNPEAFKFLFEILKDLNKSYVNNVMNTLAFALLAIGWVVTSEKSRSFLGSFNLIRFGSMAVVGIIALIHSVICIAGYFISASKLTQLTALNYAEVNYFNIYNLNGWHVLLNLVMNLSVFGLLMLLIFKTKDENID
jgi:hypothetical protein